MKVEDEKEIKDLIEAEAEKIKRASLYISIIIPVVVCLISLIGSVWVNFWYPWPFFEDVETVIETIEVKRHRPGTEITVFTLKSVNHTDRGFPLPDKGVITFFEECKTGKNFIFDCKIDGRDGVTRLEPKDKVEYTMCIPQDRIEDVTNEEFSSITGFFGKYAMGIRIPHPLGDWECEPKVVYRAGGKTPSREGYYFLVEPE